MMAKSFLSIVITASIFAFSAVLSYTINYEREAVSDNDIAILEAERQALAEQIQELEAEEELMPVEQSWLVVQAIVDQYPDLIWRSSESLEISNTDGIQSGWNAVLIAAPDLALPVMRLIQRTVSAEVLEVQLNQRQSVLLVNILGRLQ